LVYRGIFNLKEMVAELSLFNAFCELQRQNKTFMILFTSPDCGVCSQIKPGVVEMIEKEYPAIAVYLSDVSKSAELAGQLSIFVTPALLVFYEGREIIRQARFINLELLLRQLGRQFA